MQQKLSKISNLSWVIAISIIAVMAVFSFTAFQSAREYNATVEQAKLDLKRLTEIAASNVEISFISVDQTLRRAVERQYFNMLFGKNLKSDMEHNLKVWVNEVPHISAMMITDEKASVDIVFKRGEQPIQVDDKLKSVIKEHFDAQKSQEKNKLYVSPFTGADHNYILASRRIENLKGNFGGLVIAVIDGNKVIDLLSSIEKEKGIQIAILHDSGEFLIASDEKRNLFKAVADEMPKSSNILSKTINDKFRLFSRQPLHNLPVSILLSINDSDIFSHLNETNRQYYFFAGVFALFMGVIVTFAYLFDRQVKLAKKSETKALLASQAKTDFLAKMSHELRTPLNAIIGFSEMLTRGYFGSLTPDQFERISDIYLCGNHLLELINDILDFSKGGAGKLTLREEVIDIGKVVNASLRIVEQKARAGGVNVINAVNQNDNLVFADGRKLKQIILNLLSNSIKFTPEGGKVIISTHYDKDKNMVITVSDTGRGIEEKDIPKAMSVFGQVHGDTVDQGTGLGLPLCQMLTEMHGGTFELSSKVGTGTSAYITLPRSRVRRRSAMKKKRRLQHA